jgi:hypothetical protein
MPFKWIMLVEFPQVDEYYEKCDINWCSLELYFQPYTYSTDLFFDNFHTTKLVIKIYKQLFFNTFYNRFGVNSLPNYFSKHFYATISLTEIICRFSVPYKKENSLGVFHLIFVPPLTIGGHLDLPLSVHLTVRSLFVSHIAQKAIYLESWNLTGMFISMWSCAPGYFCVDIFSIFRVIALELVKISNFQLVLHVNQKVYDL